MWEKIQPRKVVAADVKVDQPSPRDEATGELVKSQRKDGALVANSATSEKEERDGELVGEETRVRDVVDLGQLLLPPLLLVLIHLAGIPLATILLICALSILCLVEYIS